MKREVGKGQHETPSSAAVVVAGGWQPIESAPRDGRHILAMDNCGYYAVLKWVDGHDWQIEGGWFDARLWTELPAPPSAEPPASGQPRGVAPAGAQEDVPAPREPAP